MSGSEDDWEKNAEKDDSELDEILQTKKFGDELSVPTPSEVKPIQPPPPSKKKYEEVHSNKNPKKSAEKNLDLEPKVIEKSIPSQNTEIKQNTVLVSDKDYTDFSKEVFNRLNTGSHHFRLPVFFKELLKECTGLMNAIDIKKVTDDLTVIHNQKLKNNTNKSKTSKNSKPSLAGEAKKNNANFRNDDEEPDEFDEYGDL